MPNGIEYSISLEELFPGVVLHYRDASSYARLVETWDAADGTVPLEADIIAAWPAASETQRLNKLRMVTFDAFEARFTSQEWDDATDFIYEVNTTTGKPKRKALVQGLGKAQARNNVDLLDAKTDGFLTLLESGGVITAARKIIILTP